MGKARDEAGNIWETDAQGNPVRLLSGGQAPAIGQAIGNDPRMPFQIQQAQGQAAAAPFAAPKAAADLARTQQEQAITAATAPAEIRQKNASATSAEINAKNLAQTGGASVEEAKAGGFYSRAIKANKAYEATHVGAPSYGREAAKAVLPDSWVNKYTSASRQQAEAAQKDFIAATLRYESGANIPTDEIENQRSIYFPAPGDKPETVALKAQLRKNAIDALDIGSGVAANRVQAPLQAAQNQSFDAAAPAGISAATGSTATELDSQAGSAIDRLIRMGRPDNEIAAYAQSKGFPAPGPEQLAQWRQFLAKEPGYQGGITQALKTRQTTPLEQLAASPLSAYFNGAGTALTAGFNDELAGGLNAIMGGDYSQGRDAFNAKKQLVAEANPKADFAGTLSGNILAMGGLNKAAGMFGGRLGNLMTAKNGIGADAAYGSAFGAGQDNENRLGGAALGFGAGAAGNIVGQGVAKGVGGLISPSGGKLAPLYEMGVRPSIGQRFGGFLNTAEEKLQSVPLLGDAIDGTRDRARDQFQVGLFNDALGEIGQSLPKGTGPGNSAHKFAQDAFNHAYDTARMGMVASADPDFGVAIGGLQTRVAGLRPNSQSQFSTIWRDAVARRFKGGNLAGEDYKAAMSEIGKKVAAIRKNQTGDAELADALDEAMGVIRDSAMRNSPPDAVAAMDAADKGYAKLVRIEDASRRRGGDAGTFSPTQYDAAVQNAAGGVRSRGYLAGDALNSHIAKAGLELRDRVSNSGTVDRLLPVAALAGAGYVEPSSALALGLYGAANAPGVRNLTTGMFAPRGSKAMRDAAERIRKLAPLLGSVGAGTGIALLPSQ